MQARFRTFRWGGLTAVGLLFVLVGVGLFVLQALRLDPFAAIADTGWPFFVILPGLTLLVLSFVPRPPHGLGFAIAGTIVTVVGSVLLYQQTTGHWESWAYAWALVGPGGAGLGMLVYGVAFRQSDLLPVGARLVAISAVIFTVGYWYFETVFSTGRVPLDLGSSWPFVLVGVGGIAVIAGLLRRPAGARTDGEMIDHSV